MPVRDLGYRPYEGDRLPPANNTKVMLRHGFRRAWGSWLVKIAVIAGWIPAVVTIAWVGVRFFLSSSPAAAAARQLPALDAGALVRSLLGWQLWLFVTMITLGAGASAIADDLRHRAFQFYLAKPVTAEQYLVGRISAVAIWCALVTFVPTVFLVLALVGTAAPGHRIDRAALLLPALLDSALLAAVASIVSVGISALGQSRALTMSAWLLIFVVPEALGLLVWQIAGWPWLRLLSLPALLGVLGDALFRVEPESALRWYHALPVLAAASLGAVYATLSRLRNVEVVT